MKGQYAFRWVTHALMRQHCPYQSWASKGNLICFRFDSINISSASRNSWPRFLWWCRTSSWESYKYESYHKGFWKVHYILQQQIISSIVYICEYNILALFCTAICCCMVNCNSSQQRLSYRCMNHLQNIYYLIFFWLTRDGTSTILDVPGCTGCKSLPLRHAVSPNILKVEG